MKPFKKPSEIAPKWPSIILSDPRYPHNVGAAVRGASCYGMEQVWVSGRRVADSIELINPINILEEENETS